MKILLLGSNGQLGMDIQNHVATIGSIDLLAVTRQDLDLANLEKIQTEVAQYSFDVLINCTGYHKTDEVEQNAAMAITINAHAVRELARACQASQSKFVHISTDYVFGGLVTEGPLSEQARPAPLNVYGASKLLGESLALAHCQQTFVCRVASLFGIAGSSGKGGNFVETMIRLAREKGKLSVVDDQVMSPTATADLARMIIQLVRQEGAPGVYHAVNTGQASWFEFAQEIIARAGIDAVVEPVSSKDFYSGVDRPSFSALNNQKLANTIGEIPNWQSALQQYLIEKGYVSD